MQRLCVRVCVHLKNVSKLLKFYCTELPLYYGCIASVTLRDLFVRFWGSCWATQSALLLLCAPHCAAAVLWETAYQVHEGRWCC